ncbi:SURF1-like protein [Roseibium aquae]|uniref:SURF1-like protein n=1 Tax=Roseibium aquae TaxID=1323746 RepID=A0A916TKZ5_9HYPH|nr:SURF1 family protein [Roseibium aquae]GGB52299.1 SURF1-like protein [Roseibium aquae]
MTTKARSNGELPKPEPVWWRHLLLPTLAAIGGLAILLNLGFWQLDRLAWKTALIERLEADIEKPPVSAPDKAEWSALTETDDYRHVSLSGKFVPGAVLYYTALTNSVGPFDGPGYLVYSPFVTDAGWTVLVNRGFIPHALPEAVRADAIAPPGGKLDLTGLLRLSEKPNWTTPAPDLETNTWFARDTDAMAAALQMGGPDLAPYSVDLSVQHTPASGLPQAGETIVRFKNDHLGYALTWFGLAATLAGVYMAYAAHTWRRRKDAGHPD